MTGFSESLTVRILADSSQFSSEMNSVSSQIHSLQGQLNGIGNAARGLNRLSSGFRSLSSPIHRVTQFAKQLRIQLRQLSGHSVSINVSPALRALQQLAAAVSRVSAMMRSIGGSISSGGTSRVSGTGNSSRVQRFATGGLVRGPRGIDQVPALLSAGEYVLQRPVVDHLGQSFLEQLNQSPRQTLNSSGSEFSPEQTVNQFGEITIQVSEMVDLNDLVSELQFSGHQLRNRRG